MEVQEALSFARLVCIMRNSQEKLLGEVLPWTCGVPTAFLFRSIPFFLTRISTQRKREVLARTPWSSSCAMFSEDFQALQHPSHPALLIQPLIYWLLKQALGWGRTPAWLINCWKIAIAFPTISHQKGAEEDWGTQGWEKLELRIKQDTKALIL